jgi:hypothetical protein
MYQINKGLSVMLVKGAWFNKFGQKGARTRNKEKQLLSLGLKDQIFEFTQDVAMTSAPLHGIFPGFN